MPRHRSRWNVRSLSLVLLLLVACVAIHWLLPCTAQHSPVAPHRSLQRGVTYVTHMSFARVSNVPRILEAWRHPATAQPGPVVVMFFAAAVQDAEGIVAYVRSDLKSPPQLAYGIYSNPSGDLRSYPVNVLRNLALGHVQTALCVMADGDMVPDRQMFADLTSSKYNTLLDDSFSTVFVLPVFHLEAPEEGEVPAVPGDKAALLAALRRGDVRVQLDHPRRPHHALTDYPRWMGEVRDYDVRYRFWYEPYLLVNVQAVPFFDPRFVYYGFDKVTYGWLLHTLGFRFRVLADHFLVHYPHSRDTGWQKTEDGSPAWQEKELLDLVEAFFQELPATPSGWRADLAAQ
eukprot:EG_transcript_14988